MSNNYFGVFREIKNDPFLKIEEINFYEDLFVDFYVNLLSNTELETEIYINQAMTCGKKIFEIACGSGRIGISLARAGFDVTGVDISKDMLGNYSKKLEKEKGTVRRNVHLFLCDITEFKIDEKYDLIILPATTICLFSDEQIRLIFDFVETHLAENGRFVFDRHVIKEGYYSDMMSKPNIFIWDDENGHHIALFQEFIEDNSKTSVVDIYCTNIKENITTRNIGYTRKRIMTEELIQKHISQSNLKEYRRISELEDAGLLFYVLEKK